MKLILPYLASLLLAASSGAKAQQPKIEGRWPSPEDVRKVAPALEKYDHERLDGDVWNRPGLSRRDRSIVTISVMIARNQSLPLNHHFGQALDNGVKPREISEVITHLAFYSGFANAFAAIGPARDVFAQRGIGPDQLPPASPTLLPLDEAAEAQRATRVQEGAGSVSPGLVKDTADVLFRDLWLRPDLAPRDRSLVTVSALAASGQVAQIPYHLNRAMDNGLTREEVGEVISHVAYYAGWPNAFSAVPVAKGVLDGRAKYVRVRASFRANLPLYVRDGLGFPRGSGSQRRAERGREPRHVLCAASVSALLSARLA
jgi:4-carboxymuconolactone decarboxylase